MRELLDALYPVNIPAGARLVASYVDGLTQPANFSQLAELFPDAVHVAISTQGADAQVLDVERGNLTPEQAPEWVARQWARGQIPTVYCSDDWWPRVIAACAAAGVPRPLKWGARWDGVAELAPDEVAKQYGGHPGYDVSVVADYWPGIDPPREGAFMAALTDAQAQEMYTDVKALNGRLAAIDLVDWSILGGGPNNSPSIRAVLQNIYAQGQAILSAVAGVAPAAASAAAAAVLALPPGQLTPAAVQAACLAAIQQELAAVVAAVPAPAATS